MSAVAQFTPPPRSAPQIVPSRPAGMALVQPGPPGPPGSSFVGFGQVSYSDRTVSTEDAYLANQRQQLVFAPDPTLTVDLLNPPFVGHGFWTANRVIPRAYGDSYDIQVNLIVTSQVAGGEVKLDADIGSTLGPVQASTQYLAAGAGISERVTFRFAIQVLANFIANGCAFYVTPSVPLTILSETVFIMPISTQAGS